MIIVAKKCYDNKIYSTFLVFYCFGIGGRKKKKTLEIFEIFVSNEREVAKKNHVLVDKQIYRSFIDNNTYEKPFFGLGFSITFVST
jgi:hypothetical protein